MVILFVPARRSSGITYDANTGTLWITKEHPQHELEAAFQFVKWMSEPPQQVRWHKGTGYFPIHKGAESLLKDEGWFEKFPNFETAFQQLRDSKPGTPTQGALMGIFPKFRDLVQTAFEEEPDDPRGNPRGRRRSRSPRSCAP